MNPKLDIEELLERLAEKVAAKLAGQRPRLAGPGEVGILARDAHCWEP